MNSQYIIQVMRDNGLLSETKLSNETLDFNSLFSDISQNISEKVAYLFALLFRSSYSLKVGDLLIISGEMITVTEEFIKKFKELEQKFIFSQTQKVQQISQLPTSELIVFQNLYRYKNPTLATLFQEELDSRGL